MVCVCHVKYLCSRSFLFYPNVAGGWRPYSDRPVMRSLQKPIAELSKEMAEYIIKKVRVYRDDRYEIKWKFRDMIDENVS